MCLFEVLEREEREKVFGQIMTTNFLKVRKDTNTHAQEYQ